MKYSFIIVAILAIAALLAVVLGIRGLPGTPTAQELNDPRWKADGPFELSPDRGRFALLYSIVEDSSLSFSNSIAQFATPDLGLLGDKYVSLFAPGLSFLLIPGYLLGKTLGAGPVGAFAVVSLFALANGVMVYLIARLLGVRPLVASLAAMGFLFATPAFSYAVTIYQHHITTFLLLLGIYAVLKWNNMWSLLLVWFLLAASLPLDYPNFFIFFPLGLYALGATLGVRITESDIRITMRPIYILSIIGVVLPLLFFFGYNKAAYGNPLQLAGTLPQVKTITGAADAGDLQSKQAITIDDAAQQGDKSAVGFFKTRNLLNGLYIHFVSPDRGILWYAPIVVLSLFGIPVLYRKNPSALSLILFTCGMTVLLYSMWGDPWGGWAFGSRYLIPVYALLSVLVAVGLNDGKFKRTMLVVFFFLFLYGASVNTLGAITSNANPPQAEVLALEKLSGKQQKYTYSRNWDFLRQKGSKSFMYNAVASRYVTPLQYYYGIVGLLAIPALLATIYLLVESYVRH